MTLPPPAVPADRLADWRQTEQRVEAAFSTPIVTVTTHTHVYEEVAERDRIRVACDIDQPWRFFFASRLRLDPPKQPSRLLTELVTRRAAASFEERLEARSFERINRTRSDGSGTGGHTDRTRFDYRAICRLRERNATISLPVAASLAIWDAGGDYHLAGGGYPSGRPDSAPDAVGDALATHTNPATAATTLDALIDATMAASRQ